MSDSPTLVPSDELAAQLPEVGEKYFIPEALALCRSLKGRKAEDLSEDEILMRRSDPPDIQAGVCGGWTAVLQPA